MSKNAFELAADGWVQLTPCGEYPHRGAGVTQVIDRRACDAMVAEFNGRRAGENFPGVLVDFDHFSLDTGKPSEAAGWITELEARDTGLWARVRWSDSGLAAVRGGRFRLVSPVFPAPDACEDLGGGRIRPLALVSVALTNEPNIRGGRPIANRGDAGGLATKEHKERKEGSSGDAGARRGKDEPKGDVMGGPGAKKFMWLLGDPPSGKHCADCVSRSGQVKTLLEWLRMPAPKCFCCCRLAEVGKDVPDDYVAPAIMTPAIGEGDALENRWAKPWGDKARAASLAVRQAKAAARAPASSLGGTYLDGQPVIRDVTAGFEDYVPGQTSISDAAPFEERQRQYGQAFRKWWDGVKTTAGNIGAFNEFVAAFGGMAAAAAGSSSPAGAASRAFGAGGTRTGQAQARRGEPAAGGADPAMDVERAKAGFIERRRAEASALADAIRRISPDAPAGLENLPVGNLKDCLRRLGGDPAKELNGGAAAVSPFEALKAKFGLSPAELEARARKASSPSKDEVRESFAQYLMETVGGRPGNVDANLADLKAQALAAEKGAARAKQEALRAQREASLSRWTYGEGSAEYAGAVRAADSAAWDFEHASRASDRIAGEYRSLKSSLESFKERAAGGGPIDWSADDADYNALLDAARRGRPVGNRWSDSARAAARASRKASGNYGGWSDAARSAALAVRRAKAGARQAALTALGGAYADGQPVIRDLTDIGSDYTGAPHITVAGPAEERQRRYEEAFRQWLDGVGSSADNIMKFHECVAALGGAAAAAAGAHNPAGAAAGAFGARYGGQRPVCGPSGNVVGWARVGGRPAAARRSGKGGGYGPDPLNGPETADDLALRESYGSHLEDIRQGYEAGMAAKGLDPQGYPLAQKPPASGGGLSSGAAREAARALGVLHGAYGVGEDGVEIPGALRGDYELGRAEGAKGYDYGIVPPGDRAAVLRGAQAYLDGAVGEDDGYSPDHLNDRYNLSDWDSAASWAARNQGKNGVYDPRAPDTRGQYSPASLMRTAMDWLRDAKARGDSGGANAALSYMSDLLSSVAADCKAAGAERGGERADAGDDEAEIDEAMPEYDADGNEVGGEPFFEDSYADPAALPPWWRLLGNRWSDAARTAARASRKTNGWGGWSDAARAASLAVRRARAALRQGSGPFPPQAQSLPGQSASDPLRVAGPAVQRQLAHPGFGVRGDAVKRKLRAEANARRKAAEKDRKSEERAARAESRNASLKEKLGQAGLRKVMAVSGPSDAGGAKNEPALWGAMRRPAGFSVPEKPAVFYADGNFYGADGKWLRRAVPAKRSGAVWQNGMWYDAATGKTLGRRVAGQ